MNAIEKFPKYLEDEIDFKSVDTDQILSDMTLYGAYFNIDEEQFVKLNNPRMWDMVEDNEAF